MYPLLGYLLHHSYQLYFFPVTTPVSAGGQDYCCLQVVSEWLCLWDECHHNAVIASGFFWKLWHSEFRVCQFKNSGGSKLVLVMLTVLMYLWLYLFCIFVLFMKSRVAEISRRERVKMCHSLNLVNGAQYLSCDCIFRKGIHIKLVIERCRWAKVLY